MGIVVSRDVVERACAGDCDAADAVRAAYEPRLRAYFWTHGVEPQDAADLVQETLVLLFAALRERRVAADRLEAWTFTTARNLRVDVIRRRQRERGERDPRCAAPATEEDLRCETDERRRAVWEAVERLPPKYRDPLVIRLREGLSYREIAERLGTNPSTVGVWLHRARVLLRDILEPR